MRAKEEGTPWCPPPAPKGSPHCARQTTLAVIWRAPAPVLEEAQDQSVASAFGRLTVRNPVVPATDCSTLQPPLSRMSPASQAASTLRRTAPVVGSVPAVPLVAVLT